MSDLHRGELSRHRLAGLFPGPLRAGAMLLSRAPDGLSQAGWMTAAFGVLMALWWTTETVPIGVSIIGMVSLIAHYLATKFL